MSTTTYRCFPGVSAGGNISPILVSVKTGDLAAAQRAADKEHRKTHPIASVSQWIPVEERQP